MRGCIYVCVCKCFVINVPDYVCLWVCALNDVAFGVPNASAALSLRSVLYTADNTGLHANQFAQNARTLKLSAVQTDILYILVYASRFNI